MQVQCLKPSINHILLVVYELDLFLTSVEVEANLAEFIVNETYKLEEPHSPREAHDLILDALIGLVESSHLWVKRLRSQIVENGKQSLDSVPVLSLIPLHVIFLQLQKDSQGHIHVCILLLLLCRTR